MHSHRSYILCLTVAALASLPAASALAGPGRIAVPPDSYINQHVDSVPQLTQQVTMDPVVRRRLAWHFHTSGPAMVRYIQDNLVVKRIPSTGRYKVWCVDSTGREYTINARLAAGTPVFVLRKTGQPVLKLACGNPMIAVLPVIKTVPSIEEAPRLASLPDTPRAAVQPELADNGPVVVVTNSGVEVTPAPVVQVAEFPPTLMRAAGHGGSPLGFLAGIPILAGLVHHSGSSSSPPAGTGTSGPGNSTGPGTGPGNSTGPGTGPGNSTGPGTGPGNSTGPGTGPGNNTGPGPVPEPAPTTSFAIGGLGVALLILTGRRRSRKARI